MKVCVDCRGTMEIPIIKLRGGLFCPRCGGEIVHSEEFYLEAIKELNEKGYFVASYDFKSITSTNKTTSIIFDECIDSLPCLPNDCYVEVIGPKGEQCIKLNYTFVDCETELSVLRNSINVFVWAVRLPEVGTDEYFNALKTCYINNIGEDPE